MNLDEDEIKAENVFRDLSDDELVNRSVLEAPHAELLRRNTEALRESAEASEKSSKRILFLTIILLAIGGTQLILDIVPFSDIYPWIRYVMGLTIFLAILVYVTKTIINDDW